MIGIRSSYDKDLSDDDRQIFDRFFPDIAKREKLLNFFSKIGTGCMAVVGTLLTIIEIFNLWQFIALASFFGYVSVGIIVVAILVKLIVGIYRRYTVDLPRNKLLGQYSKDSLDSGVANAFTALKEIKSTASTLRSRLFVMADHFDKLDSLVSPEDVDIKNLIESCRIYINESQHLLSEESIDLICHAILNAADDKIVNPKPSRSSKLFSFFGAKEKQPSSQQKQNQWMETEKFKNGFFQLTGIDITQKSSIKNQDVFNELHKYLIATMPKISASISTLEQILHSMPCNTLKDSKDEKLMLYGPHDLKMISAQLQKVTRMKMEEKLFSRIDVKAKQSLGQLNGLIPFNDVVQSAVLNQPIEKIQKVVRQGLAKKRDKSQSSKPTEPKSSSFFSRWFPGAHK